MYIEEVLSQPSSVTDVDTAVPAFVGYTEKATRADGGDLALRPTKIHSFADYAALFGGPHAPRVAIAVDAAGEATVTPPELTYLLYYAVRMYFDNGGGPCFVVSVGGYQDPPSVALDAAPDHGLRDGLDAIEDEDEPTLLVIPEAVGLGGADYATLVRAALAQCERRGNRFAIFDVPAGGEALTDLAATRALFGTENLSYGAAYYPFVESGFNCSTASDGSDVDVTIGGAAAVTLDSLAATRSALHYALRLELEKHHLTLPPSGAIAGCYVTNDAQRGVWKAPAGLPLTNVLRPAVQVDERRQEELKLDAATGVSINVIRAFAGRGTLLWGARTLDGDSNEWRYVSVRRFFNAVRESIATSSRWVVFEPNDANTWTKVRGMIEDYLTNKWRDGAIAGSTTEEAFFVRCGLGTTMTPQDVFDGRLEILLGLAMVRPAEFIVLKLSQRMQTS